MQKFDFDHVEEQQFEKLYKSRKSRKLIKMQKLLQSFQKEKEVNFKKGYIILGFGALLVILLISLFHSFYLESSIFEQGISRTENQKKIYQTKKDNFVETKDASDLKDSQKNKQENTLINPVDLINKNDEKSSHDFSNKAQGNIENEKGLQNPPTTNSIQKRHNSAFEKKNYLQMLSSDYNFQAQKLQNKEYFAYSLYRQPQNQNFLQIERKRFNQLYKIAEVEKQLPFCVTIVGYSTMFNYKIMLRSVFRQNYTNFHVVYVDDASPKRVQLGIDQYVKDLSNQKPQNIKLILNQNKQFALKNRDKIIRNHCNPGQIIIDLDSDDSLIGKQVFRLVNSFYQKDPELWLFYMNNLILDKNIPLIPKNFLGGVPDDILETNTYRTSKMWKSHHLRTYKRQLYMKIDQKDFVNADGDFYIWKADAFILVSLSEMAGKAHQKKIDEPVYFYNLRTFRSNAPSEKQLCYYAFKMQTPYQPLSDLSEEAKKTPDYVLPEWIVHAYKDFKTKYSGKVKINQKNYENTLKLIQQNKEEDPQLKMKITEEETILDQNEINISEEQIDIEQNKSADELLQGSIEN